jgi:hypothetical protein
MVTPVTARGNVIPVGGFRDEQQTGSYSGLGAMAYQHRDNQSAGFLTGNLWDAQEFGQPLILKAVIVATGHCWIASARKWRSVRRDTR